MRNQRSFSLEFKRQVVEEPCTTLPPVQHHLSSFYYKPRVKSPEDMKAEADLRDRIETICLGFPRCGYRRVSYQLKREGKQLNRTKVLRLIRETNLLCRVKRK
jgi:putative transposase